MRVVVCGSRDFEDSDVVHQVLWGLLSEDYGWNEWGLHSNVTIIEGACPFGGADLHAETFAKEHGARHESFPPKEQTARGYHARNRAMIASGADLCVAFVNKPLAVSRGTAYTVAYARKNGVKTIVVEA